MPLALATAEGRERSGYVYDDITGVSYEYPTRYARLMVPGEPFVYHMPNRGYTGAAVVGSVRESVRPDHLVCEVIDYQPFGAAVPLRAPDGYYYEADPERGKLNVYWSQGVRPLRLESYERILGSAQRQPAPVRLQHRYATHETAAAVERFSVDRALQWLRAEYPDAELAEMPHNNPGFDVLVTGPGDFRLHVEVKGTQAPVPAFFMSEGERLFSVNNADKYLFVCVYDIDLESGQATVLTKQGPVGGEAFHLIPAQWRGLLRS
ncbi:MAG TPA: DUF3883 domain-containing protein [Naasia sp.]|jgi:hypothetical protein